MLIKEWSVHILRMDWMKKISFVYNYILSEPVFLNVYGARESIPRNEFREPV